MLPKIDVPIYEVKLPLLKKTCRFRPFLVKEEKLLLMAMESEDEKTVTDTIKQIINNCCLDELDIDSLPISDLEIFFLNLRARSVGEQVEMQYRCNNTVEKENGEMSDCGNLVKMNMNLLEVTPSFTEGHTNKIELSDKMGIVMKYPTFKMIDIENNENKTEVESLMDVILDCVDFIYDEDSLYYQKDIDRKELQEFVESLTREQFIKVQNFFETMPKVKKDLHFKCNKCGYEEKIFVEGIQNFFV